MNRNGILTPKRLITVALPALVALAALPGVASAATVSRDATTLSFTAGQGEANETAAFASGTDIVFTDDGAPLIDGDGTGGCVVTGIAATCPSAGLLNTQVALGNGSDTFGSAGNLAALSPVTVDAGPGADTVRGTNGSDLILGGDNADFIDAQQGTDTVFAGTGNDVMQWDPGDGNDTLEGQDDVDTLVFNGSNIGEAIDLSANGSRVLLTRNIASIVMDLDDVEAVEPNSFGGADVMTVNDLSGTDVTEVTANLAALGGGGDGQPDQVVANATEGVDSPTVAQGGGGARVTGLAVRTTATNAEPNSDVLRVNTLGGNDQPRALPGAGALAGVVIDGGADADTIHAPGTGGADVFSLASAGAEAAVSSDGGSSIVRTISENLSVELLGGDDSASAVGNLAALTQLTIDAGAGADTVLGGNGSDLVLAGTGSDFIDAQQGTDTVFAGTGNDVMQWDPGDGNDTLEGQENSDKLVFNGSSIGEIVELSANGTRARLTRNIASIVMDLNDVEAVDHNSFGGADVTTVNDLAGTDLTAVNENLAALGGGGDAQPDQVIVNGTAGADNPGVAPGGGGARVSGLAARTTVINAEPANDQLRLNALGGDDHPMVNPTVAPLARVLVDGGADTDTVRARGTSGADTFDVSGAGLPEVLVSGDNNASAVQVLSENVRVDALGGNDDVAASGNLAGLTALTIDAGGGADAIGGGDGADVILGGAGGDGIDANEGDDVVLAGTGNDLLFSNPGDGADTLEGQANRDTLRLNGNDGPESVELSANGPRLTVTRDGASAVDANDVETVEHRPLGGVDTTTLNDLSGTDVTSLREDLASTPGGSSGDGQPDTVALNATDGDDTIAISGSAAAGVNVAGLVPRLAIRNQEPAADQLQVHTLLGSDTVNTNALAPGTIGLAID